MLLSDKMRQFIPLAGKFWKTRPAFQKALTPLMILHSLSPVGEQSRTLTTKSHQLTKSLTFMTSHNGDVKMSPTSPLQLKAPAEERPLSILLCWLMSQKKHIFKYAKFYLDQGFDVLTVRINPLELLWPVTGSQLIAKDLLAFMSQNDMYKSTILHGFSVGGYLWGEALNMMIQDPAKYEAINKRIIGQIWDSVVDFEGIPTGLPRAVFPNNTFLRTSLEKYVRYHMAKYEQVATQHYLRSSAAYHNTFVKAPALFLCSLDDPVGSIEGIERVRNKWENGLGMEVYLKAWQSSPHVSHLHHHPQEYKEEMKKFLEMLNLVPFPEKFLQSARS